MGFFNPFRFPAPPEIPDAALWMTADGPEQLEHLGDF